MKFSRAFSWVAGFLATSGLALAHPGHDGHEPTWEFRHLAAHPFATFLCFAFMIAAAWFLARLAVSGGELATQSLRDSDRKDGK